MASQIVQSCLVSLCLVAGTNSTRNLRFVLRSRSQLRCDTNVNISTPVLIIVRHVTMLTSMTIDAMKRVSHEDGLVPFDEDSCRRYRAEGLWSGLTLAEELTVAAARHADRVGLIAGGEAYTYSELFGWANRFAAGLRDLAHVRAGDAVMFQMGNVVETVVAYLGCVMLGARPVCTLPQHGAREIGLLADHVGAKCLISQVDFGRGRLVEQAQQLMAGSLATVVVARGPAFEGALSFADLCVHGADPGTEPAGLPGVDPLTPVVFQLSGGTTGLPKVAARLHEEYAYNARAWAQVMGYTPATIVLYPLPLMHNAGIELALQPAIFSGATLVLAETANVDLVLDLIEEHRPDVLPLVPPALAIRLLDSPRAASADLSCIRDFVVGGQRLAVEVAERLRDELNIAVRQMFGMAEGMFLVTPRDATEYVRHHTVGAAISPFDEIRILEPDSDNEVPAGTVGEFVARGPYTIRGYYRADAHNASSFTPDGFYRTGDLARRHDTADGSFYSIDGRIKDVINRGVEKIHAEEVEELIVRHQDVVTAALVAMPDLVLGEKACAYLVMEQGAPPLTVAALGQHLLDRGLSRYKLPERVEIVTTLPLTNVGKVAKKDLRMDIERKLNDEAGAVT